MMGKLEIAEDIENSGRFFLYGNNLVELIFLSQILKEQIQQSLGTSFKTLWLSDSS